MVSRKIWPMLIAAGLAGFVLYDLQLGLTPRSIGLLVLSDAVEVLITVVGLSYAFDGPVRLDSIKSLAKFSFVAVILAPLVAAFIATTAFDGNYWIRWRIGFFTEALALLTLTPAILSWVATIRRVVCQFVEQDSPRVHLDIELLVGGEPRGSPESVDTPIWLILPVRAFR